MVLSKQELENEIKAVENVLKTHEESLKLNALGVRANCFILNLLEKELERFK